MTVTFAIVGRPNVGKSTLFNRLIGRQHAIVDDQPGVTRDRREGQGYLATLAFTVIDTAGLEEADEGSLEARMRRQTEMAICGADITLMVVDTNTGEKAKFTSKNTIIESYKSRNILNGKVLYSNNNRLDVNNILRFY